MNPWQPHSNVEKNQHQVRPTLHQALIASEICIWRPSIKRFSLAILITVKVCNQPPALTFPRDILQLKLQVIPPYNTDNLLKSLESIFKVFFAHYSPCLGINIYIVKLKIKLMIKNIIKYCPQFWGGVECKCSEGGRRYATILISAHPGQVGLRCTDG